jgi:hypothetical protein
MWATKDLLTNASLCSFWQPLKGPLVATCAPNTIDYEPVIEEGPVTGSNANDICCVRNSRIPFNGPAFSSHL